jgi:type I restriction enzyme M protein
VLPSVRAALFGPGDRPGYASPRVGPGDVKAAILGHPEFAAFSTEVEAVFDGWRAAHVERLKAIDVGDKPKAIIEAIAEDLLALFADVPLIDRYDIYQHLMTYWAEVMQDDVYILAQDGWPAARRLREIVRGSDGKFTEEPDLVLGAGRGARRVKAELIPPAVIVARFFAAEREALEKLEAAAEDATRAIEEMVEEHGGEEGLLFEAMTDKGTVTVASLKARLREIKSDPVANEERDLLAKCLGLIETERGAADAAKEVKAMLDAQAAAKYGKLTDAEAQTLVVDDKWMAGMWAMVHSELDSVSHTLTTRVRTLAERYDTSLPTLCAGIEILRAKVNAHLQLMGFTL